MSDSNSNSGWVILIVGIIALYFVYKIVIFIISLVPFFGFNSFYFIDNLFAIEPFNPIIVWGLWGALFGSIVGVGIAIKKLKLSLTLILYPTLTMLVLVTIFGFINAPLKHSTVNKVGAGSTRSEDSYPYINITSSSVLPSVGYNITYSPANLLDRNVTTAWIENAPGPGIGEHIDFYFNKGNMFSMDSVMLVGFKMVTGYNKSADIWYKHNRVSSIGVYKNNILIGNFGVGDYWNWQTIVLPHTLIQNGDQLSVKVLSVKYGNKYTDQTAISELVPMIEYLPVINP